MGDRIFLGLVVFAAGVFSSVPAAASLTPEQWTLEKDTLQVTLTAQRDALTACLRDVRIRIQEQAVPRINGPIAPHLAADWMLCEVTRMAAENLNGDRTPEVIVDLYSGGAHCCHSTLIYAFGEAARSPYAVTAHTWGNRPYTLQDLDEDGRPEFVSQDDRFAYAFSVYAASRYPIQIWQYQEAALVEATPTFQQAVFDHAFQLWEEFRRLTRQRGQARSDSTRYWQAEAERATLAAYLADKYLLGQGQDGWERVRQHYNWPDRDEFFAQLEQFLADTGYADLPQDNAPEDADSAP